MSQFETMMRVEVVGLLTQQGWEQSRQWRAGVSSWNKRGARRIGLVYLDRDIMQVEIVSYRLVEGGEVSYTFQAHTDEGVPYFFPPAVTPEDWLYQLGNALQEASQ